MFDLPTLFFSGKHIIDVNAFDLTRTDYLFLEKHATGTGINLFYLRTFLWSRKHTINIYIFDLRTYLFYFREA